MGASWACSIAIAAVPFLAALPAAAQTWPTRAVKIVTPQPGGTAIDVGLRLVADRLSKRWGQGVVVENRPGGEGVTATAGFIQAKDDHALFGSPGYPFTIAPYMLDTLPYNPADVTPITLVFETPLMVAVHNGVAANTLGELDTLAKASPGKLNWASTAGLPNFSFNFFAKSNGLDMAYVPYRDAASALNDLGEGRIQVYVTSYGTVMPLIEAGKIRVLAILGEQRIEIAPQIPTAIEAGYGRMVVVGFSGLFGLKDMPQAQRDRIAADIAAITRQPEVLEFMKKNVQIARGSTAAEFGKILDDQRVMVGEMLRTIGVGKPPAK